MKDLETLAGSPIDTTDTNPRHDIEMLVSRSSMEAVACHAITLEEPNLIVFVRAEQDGCRSYIVQHYSQVNVLFRIVKMADSEKPRTGVGFELPSPDRESDDPEG